jgi:hypothetical protein
MLTPNPNKGFLPLLAAPPHRALDPLLLVFIWAFGSFPWILGWHYIPYDSLDQFYPQSRFVVDAIREGTLPFWNPYQYSGTPVLGDPQGLIVTIHTLVGLLFGDLYTLYVFDLTTLLHPLVGGLFLYAYGAKKGIPRIWLLVAASVFMLGGVSTSRLQHVPQIISYSFVPIILYLMDSLSSRPRWWKVGALVSVLTLWAANANQVVFLSAIFLGFCALYFLVHSRRPFALFSRYLFAAVLSALLLTPLYLSVLDVVNATGRDELTVLNSAASSFPLHVFASVVLPALFGNMGRSLWAPTDITQDFLYIGVLPILLFLAAFFLRVRTITPTFFLGVFVFLVFFGYSLGTNSPLYPLLFEHLPGVELFRRPADAAYVLNILFAFAVLFLGRQFKIEYQVASRRLEMETKTGLVSERVVFVYLGIALLVGIFVGPFACAKSALDGVTISVLAVGVRLLLLLLVLFLIRHLARLKNGGVVAFLVIGAFVAVDFGLAGRYKGSFVGNYATTNLAQNYKKIGDRAYDELDLWLRERTRPWSRVEVIGGPRAGGHSSLARWHHTQGYNPIILDNYDKLVGGFVTMAQPRTFRGTQEERDAVFDQLGYRYVAFWERLLAGNPEEPLSGSALGYRDSLRSAGGSVVFSGGGYEVWERHGQNRWLVARDVGDRIWEAERCRLEGFSNTRVALSCASGDAGSLVVGEVVAPGWRACVNGEAVELRAERGLFRMIEIPAERSDVVFEFVPWQRLWTKGKALCRGS